MEAKKVRPSPDYMALEDNGQTILAFIIKLDRKIRREILLTHEHPSHT